MSHRKMTGCALLALSTALGTFVAHDCLAESRENNKDAHHQARLEGAAKSGVARTIAAASVQAETPAAGNPSAKAEATEAVETVEAVEPVEAVDAVSPAPIVGSEATQAGSQNAAVHSFSERATILLGHLHAAVVHLPIAWVLLWVMFDALGLWLGQTHLWSCGPWLGAFATLSFAPAALSGLVRLDELARAASDTHTMDPALVHRNLMWIGLVLCAVTSLTRRNIKLVSPIALRIGYTLLLVTCIGLVGYSAHLGGALVYGDEFLTF